VKRRFSWPLFWALVAVFVVTVCLLLVPQFRESLGGSWLFLTPLIVFFLLGVALLVFTLLEKVSGRLKGFLLLTGASAAGYFIFVLLHNAFYALGTISGDLSIIGPLVDFLDAAFFFMAILVCPLGFLVGAIGSVVLLLKKSG
jgi:hypothetical protein